LQRVIRRIPSAPHSLPELCQRKPAKVGLSKAQSSVTKCPNVYVSIKDNLSSDQKLGKSYTE
jgi:hypothetical protein